MGRLIDFETSGVASLRRRVAEVEESHRDLLAFTRGHSGAVAAVHAAALLAVEADAADTLAHVVTQEWPDLLGVDAVAFALWRGGRALCADACGVQWAETRLIERMIAAECVGVTLRAVARGHPLFGPASDLIRAEASIRLDGPAALPAGVLMLGQRRAQGFEARHGSELLLFLGGIVARMMARWLPG